VHDQFLTVDELSARYRGAITPEALAKWRKDGCGPDYLPLDGSVVYPLAAVQEWEISMIIATSHRYPAVIFVAHWMRYMINATIRFRARLYETVGLLRR
jgi:hypothetical protein